MRAETKYRLERAIWMQRAKYAGIGLGLCLVMAGLFAWISADSSVQLVRVPATVTAVRPLATKNTAAGLIVEVKLADGKVMDLMVNQITDPKIGQQVEITEHRHATGRKTHSWK
ncbi:MAG: hypothetical protein ABL901_05230 [Hyphomicrobiaceae bacterium]